MLRVIEFYAKWCGPCQRISADIDNLVDEYPQIDIERRDMDEETDDPYQIRSVPTFVFLVDGEEVDRVVGADLDAVRRKIERLSSPV